VGIFLGLLVIICFIVHLAKARGEKTRVERRRIDRVNQRYSDPTLRQLITEKKIWQGMTQEQLIDSWGKPFGLTNRVLKTKVKQTYAYGSQRGGSKVYVDNGIVVGWYQPDERNE
jgi:hypothetical protein